MSWTGRIPPRLRSGWTAAAAIAAAVLLVWLPDLRLPLGDSDDGRILARYGLQARNFWELGPAQSDFGARVEPYIRSGFGVEPPAAAPAAALAVEPPADPPDAAVTYAHHPPLQVFVIAASVGLLGDGPAALRLPGFAIGAATVMFMAALLRGRGLEWGPILVALGAMVATGFFYIYGRLGVGFSLVVAAAAMVAHLRDAPRPSRKLLAAGAAVAALAALQSWIAMAAVGLLVLWLWLWPTGRTGGGPARAARPAGGGPARPARAARPAGGGPARAARAAGGGGARSTPPVLRWVAAGAAVGVAVTAVWMLNATGPGELSDQVALRTGVSDGDFGEFLAQQWRFASDFAPAWLRWLAAPALVAGLADRRTRPAAVVTLAVAAAWTFGLRQGAWVHRLWNFPWLAPVTIGLAALADAVRRLIRGRVRLAAAAGIAAAAVIAVTAFRTVAGDARDAFLTDPAAAGSVVEQVGPGHASGRFWVAGGVTTPRWASYYLDVPVWTLEEEGFDDLAPGDSVLVRTDKLPGFLADRLPASPAAGEIAEGRYRLIPARALIE